ncbi:hypothetical protein FRC00_002777 [Tulasnella sp. 408]|nr:hypothetical protein FRC00_002777 [Tulasnella sp. 408]
MSDYDDSYSEPDEVMSYVSTTFSEADVRSLSTGPGLGTLTSPVGQYPVPGEANKGQKHPKYYLSNFVNIQVKNMLYRVPHTILQQSEIFGTNLHKYEASGALDVKGITTQEMEAFLDVSDARLVTGDDHFTLEQWLGAVATADRLGIPRIRNYAAGKAQPALNRLDPFECIDVATKYRVYGWLLQPYARICERPESLSPAEMARLGLERASAVCRVREKLFTYKYQSTKSWIATNWPGNPYGRSSSSSQPQWEQMEETIRAQQATNGLNLVQGEAVLSRPTFQSPGAEPPVYTVPQGKPHPKYWQTDLREMKVGSAVTLRSFGRSSRCLQVQNSLYQLPIRYFERPDLLGEIPARRASSSHSGGLLTLPQDVPAYEWNIFLDILTARPFDEPWFELVFWQWKIGLRLAVRFGHDSARRYILDRIAGECALENPIDLLEAAELASAPDSPWLQGLYKALSERKGSLSPEDIDRIGKKATAEVLKLRDQYMWSAGQKGCHDVF